MRAVACLVLCLLPFFVQAQSSTVLPEELTLSVTVEATDHPPLVREMVLITIRGQYRRHITREKLIQPDLDGFSWTQLGNDFWREERIDGQRVKTFTRRMAIYPDRPGKLTIGAFTHELTLTDEGDDWFAHQVRSEPVTIEVHPAPRDVGWWFPVRRLRISDEWSNAPDQLRPGEGVLRVVRVEALGVMPEMIPPMPELASPSAMVFPHPEQRFAELTPQGPVSYAFWRWTIRPSNDTSGIVEPLRFEYFDTASRQMREVTISAQRVAYGSAVPDDTPQPLGEQAATYALPVNLLAATAVLVFAGGLAHAQFGRRMAGVRALHRFLPFDPLARRLRRAARDGQLSDTRRAARAMMRRDGISAHRRQLMAALDRGIYAPAASLPSLRDFARAFVRDPSSGR